MFERHRAYSKSAAARIAGVQISVIDALLRRGTLWLADTPGARRPKVAGTSLAEWAERRTRIRQAPADVLREAGEAVASVLESVRDGRITAREAADVRSEISEAVIAMTSAGRLIDEMHAAQGRRRTA